MLTVLGSPRQLCDGLTRRETLTAGALSLVGGLSLPRLLAAEARKPAIRAKAKHVIVLNLLGGAATQDMFDLKPSAPVGVRGEFKPIATRATGVRICEHLPRLAKWMHRAALIRSVTHRAGCHNPLPSYTGSEQALPNIVTTNDNYPPSMGSVCEWLRQNGQGGKRKIDLPDYVYMPCYLGWGQVIHRPGPWAGFLGKQYDCAVHRVPALPRQGPNLPAWPAPVRTRRASFA